MLGRLVLMGLKWSNCAEEHDTITYCCSSKIIISVSLSNLFRILLRSSVFWALDAALVRNDK